MKYFITSLFFLVLISCKKEKNKEVNPADTYGEKIVGIWTCDSIVVFKPNYDTTVYYTTDTVPYNNAGFIYDYTDIVPKTYIFKKSTGLNIYEWNDDLVEMNEEEGWMYKEGPLGDAGEFWFITYIDQNKCVLKLDFSPAPAVNVISQHWYYLSR